MEVDPLTRVGRRAPWTYRELMRVLPPSPTPHNTSPRENLYANGHLVWSLYFSFLKIGLQLFKALQQALKDPEKQWLDAQCIYHKARRKMFKHFPKAVTLEI